MFSKLFQKFYVFLFIYFYLIQFNQALRCYECLDCTDATCTCENIIETDAKDSFCTLVRENTETGANFEIRHLPRNLTGYYETDPYYISVREIISYNTSIDQWLSHSNMISYACQTDECNRPDLLKELPANGLSLMLPSSWLNENLQQQSPEKTSKCYNCPTGVICSQTPYKPDNSTCELTDCTDVCIVDQIIQKSQPIQYCYELYCLATTLRTPKIFVHGIYYINSRKFELIETDIICRGPDCSRLDIFQTIEDKLQKNYNNVKPFLPSNVNRLSTSLILIFIMIIIENFVVYSN